MASGAQMVPAEFELLGPSAHSGGGGAACTGGASWRWLATIAASTMWAMLLNQTVVYALRAMATMAELAPGASVTVVELSERTGVPQHYLSKVMRRMVKAKLVNGQRGHGGGFALVKAPADIRIADILLAVDADLALGQCAFGFDACDPDNPCMLHPVWAKLQDGMKAFAAGSTLADCGGARVRRRARASS